MKPKHKFIVFVILVIFTVIVALMLYQHYFVKPKIDELNNYIISLLERCQAWK